MITKRKVFILVSMVILFRFFNIYTSLQHSILSYRPIEIQPIKSNEITIDLSNAVAKETEVFINDPIEQDSNTVHDPVTDINITVEAFNLYTLEELIHFKGIGEKTAQAIIEYRNQHGGFTDFKELLLVKGIGEKKLEQLLNGK
ncbi:helix-hairpin-helix domain-containing protein [Fusibacter sp. 3D3]|uniref:ComEA family DNA-binding protein n=1 Tax=Fusibacter sp. 3D3 TaxID=1048380 RepID=UPI0008532D89|nr:helix-hairpin-helix domain-containing protein [Fusibacter sp. 3D3]GAU77439.1 late competence protein ComEA [Fusibacter sp. 3D3]